MNLCPPILDLKYPIHKKWVHTFCWNWLNFTPHHHSTHLRNHTFTQIAIFKHHIHMKICSRWLLNIFFKPPPGGPPQVSHVRTDILVWPGTKVWAWCRSTKTFVEFITARRGPVLKCINQFLLNYPLFRITWTSNKTSRLTFGDFAIYKSQYCCYNTKVNQNSNPATHFKRHRKKSKWKKGLL